MDHGEYRSLWKSLFCVNLINSTQAAIAVVGIPTHSATSHFDDHQLALLLGTFPIAAGVAALGSGTLSDLIGRRTALIAGLLVLSLALGLHSIAPDFETLLFLRALSGLATGALTGIPSALLSDTLAPEKQIPATSKTLSGYALGQAIGIPMGIAVLEVASFPRLCSYLGIITFALTLYIRIRIPTVNPSRYYRSGGLGAYAKDAMAILKNQRFVALALANYLSFSGISLFCITLTLWLFREVQLGPSGIAPMHFWGGIAQAAVLLLVTRKANSGAPAKRVAFSLLLNSCVFALAYFALRGQTSASIILALTLGSVALRIPSVQYLTHNLGPRAQKGLRTSLVQTGNHLGKASGYILAGLLFDPLKVHQIVLLCGILTLLGSVLLLLTHRRKEFGSPEGSKHSRGLENGLSAPTDTAENVGLWHVRC